MLQKNNTILKIFLESPTSRFQLRELSRESKLSTTAVKSALKNLLSTDIIKTEREKKYLFYRASSENEKFKLFKKFYTIKSIIESDLLKFIDKEFYYPEAVILFGSAARGEDIKRSDIDIFILTTKKKEVSVEKFEKKLKKPLKLLIMDKKEFEIAKKRNPELINSIANGIALKGHLELL